MDVLSIDSLTRAMLDAGWPQPVVPPLVLSLAEAYATPPRAYHDLRHIEELLEWHRAVEREGPGWRHPSDVLAAIVYHDAIYEAGRPDNEARSAHLAREAIARFGLPCDAERVSALILATARHGSRRVAADEDVDLPHFLDADMAILGSPAERYEAYEQAIQREYAAVPSAAFRAGRRAFLERVLALPRIYETEFFSSRLESSARANLTRASAALKA